jgi:hypothetical protein
MALITLGQYINATGFQRLEGDNSISYEVESWVYYLDTVQNLFYQGARSTYYVDESTHFQSDYGATYYYNYGQVITSECLSGTTTKRTWYSDGAESGWHTDTVNSPDCGYVSTPPSLSASTSFGCSGTSATYSITLISNMEGDSNGLVQLFWDSAFTKLAYSSTNSAAFVNNRQTHNFSGLAPVTYYIRYTSAKVTQVHEATATMLSCHTVPSSTCGTLPNNAIKLREQNVFLYDEHVNGVVTKKYQKRVLWFLPDSETSCEQFSTFTTTTPPTADTVFVDDNFYTKCVGTTKRSFHFDAIADGGFRLFDGVDDVVNLSSRASSLNTSLNGGTNVTIEGWIEPDVSHIDNEGMIFNLTSVLPKQGQNSQWAGLLYGNGTGALTNEAFGMVKVRNNVNDGSYRAYVSNDPNRFLNKRTYFSAVFAETYWKLFLDGIEVQLTTDDMQGNNTHDNLMYGFNNGLTTPTEAYAGGRYFNNALRNLFKGKLMLRLWNKAFTKADAQEWMSKPEALSSTPNLVDQWKLDENSGTVANALKGNHGVIENATSTVASEKVTITNTPDSPDCGYVPVSDDLSLTATSTPASAFGSNNGTVTANASGTNTPFLYAIKLNSSSTWSTNQSSNIFNSLGAGTYDVRATDSAGFTRTTSATVTQPNQLTLTKTAHNNVTTVGGSNGSVSVQSSGGVSPFQFSKDNVNWTTASGTNTHTFSNLTVGNYTFYVRDVNGSTALINAYISEPTSTLDYNVTPTPATEFGVSNGKIDITVTSGSAPYTYSIKLTSSSTWITNSTGAFTGLPAGTYDVRVTDSINGTVNKSTTVTQPALLTLNVTSTTNVTTDGGSDGAATVQAGGGILPYQYSLDSSNWTSTTNNTTHTFTGLAAGTRTFFVRDANGVVRSTSAVIGSPTNNLSATASATPASYFGANDGTATINATGTNTPFVYSIKLSSSSTWPNNMSTNSFGGLAAGTYDLRVTDSAGYTAIASATVTQPAQLTLAVINKGDATTAGGAEGYATVQAGGGVGPFQFSRDNVNYSSLQASATYTFTGLAAGNHGFFVRDSTNQVGNTSVVINQPSNTLSVSATATAASYYGANNGTVTVNANGTNTPFVYAIKLSTSSTWTANQSSNVFSGLAAGTYDVRVTDSANYTATASVTVTQPAQLVLTLTNKTDATTIGGTDGTATIQANGGVGPFQFSRDGNSYTDAQSSNSTTFTGLNAGTHSFFVRDSTNQVSSTSVVINQPSNTLAFNAVATPTTEYSVANGRIDITVTSGSAPYVYSIKLATSSTWITNSTGVFTGLAAGVYDARVVDNVGASLTKSVTVNEPALLTINVTQINHVTTNGGSNGSITVQGGGGVMNYAFSIDNVTFYTTANNWYTFSSLPAGTYTIWIKDANGVSKNTSAVVNSPSNTLNISVSTTGTTEHGVANGKLTVTASGANPPFSYSIKLTSSSTWTTNSTGIFTGLAAGTYDVSVRDDINYTATSTGIITQPALLTIDVTQINHVTTNGGTNGSLTVGLGGGVAPYQVSLDNATWVNVAGSSHTFTGLGEGLYTIFVRDTNGVSKNTSARINGPNNNLTISVATTGATQYGASDGKLTITATGSNTPFSYSIKLTSSSTWATNSTGIFTGLAAGTYDARVIDSANYTATSTGTITQPPLLTITRTAISHVTTIGGSDGSVTVQAGGGVGPYQFSKDNSTWSTAQGGTNYTFSGLSAGAYTFYVKDSTGVVKSLNETVTQPTNSLTISLTHSGTTEYGASDGRIVATVAGTHAPFDYYIFKEDLIWHLVVEDTNSTTWAFEGLSARPYSIRVIDSIGTQVEDSRTIGQPDLLVISKTAQTDVTANGAADGSVSLQASGGVSPYRFSKDGTSWTNAQTASTITFTGLTAGIYTFYLRDNNNVTKSLEVTVGQPADTLSISAVATGTTEYGVSNGRIVVTAANGYSPYKYFIYKDNAWVSGATSEFTGLAAATYNLRVTDSKNYTKETTATVTQPALVTITKTAQTNVTTVGGTQGSVTVEVAGGVSPYQFSKDNTTWSTAQTGTSYTFNGLTEGNYTLYVRDINGVKKSTTATISGPTSDLTISLTHSGATAYGAADGRIVATITGTHSPFDYYIFKNGLWELVVENTTSKTWAFEGLSAGPYSIRVIDNAGYQVEDSRTIGQPALLTITTTNKGNATTVGGNQGFVTLQAGGGVTPYQFSKDNSTWVSVTGNTHTFSGLTAGTYTFYVIDANGVKKSLNETITQPANTLTISATATGATTHGGSDGKILITATGTNTPFTYSYKRTSDTTWISSNTSTVTGLTAGFYDVRVTDAALYSKEVLNIEITQPVPNDLSISVSVTGVTNNGGYDGQIRVNVLAGTNTPFTYFFRKKDTVTWVSGATNTFSSLYVGFYDVRVVDSANHSREIYNVEVTEPALIAGKLNISVYTVGTSSYGAADGQATVDATGTNPPFTYFYRVHGATTWVQGNGTFTGLAAGYYDFKVTDSTNYSREISKVRISQPEPETLAFTVSTTGATTVGGNDGKALINVTVGNNPPFRYFYKASTSVEWISGATTSFAGLRAGFYDFRVIDSANTTREVTYIEITEPVNNLKISAAVTGVTTVGGNDGAIKVIVLEGANMPFKYFYRPSGTATWISGATNTFGGLTAGLYDVQVVDSYNFTKTLTNITVSEPTLGAIKISVSITGTTRIESTDGRALVGVEVGIYPDFTFYKRVAGTTRWVLGTSKDFTGLAAGFYDFKATDTKGNSDILYNIEVPYPKANNLEIEATGVNTTSVGGTDGKVIIEILAGTNTPFQYFIWNNGWVSGATNVFTGLTAGTYMVLVNDRANFSREAEAIVKDPSSDLQATAVGTAVTSIGGTDGKIVVTAKGSYAPFQYFILLNGLWVSGATNTFTGLSAGTYNLKVTDTTTTSVETTAVVNEATCVITIDAKVENETSYNAKDGIITAIVGKPKGTVKYKLTTSGNSLVSGYSSTSIFTNLVAGIYTLYAKDATNCEVMKTNLEVKPLVCDILLTGTVAHETNLNVANGKITVSAITTGGAVQYKVGSNGAYSSINEFTGLAAGTYTVYAKDGKGCETKRNFVINPYSCNILLTLTSVEEADYTLTVTASATTTGGTVKYRLGASGRYISNNVFTGLKNGTFRIFAKDASGCETYQDIVTNTVHTATTGFSYSCENSDKVISQTITYTSKVENFETLKLRAYNDAQSIVMAKVANSACEMVEKGHSNLFFGEETILLGNVSTNKEEEVELLKHVLVLSSSKYYQSNNPTWTAGIPVHITEVGVYDDKNNLVAIAKLDTPITKDEFGVVVLQIDLEF